MIEIDRTFILYALGCTLLAWGTIAALGRFWPRIKAWASAKKPSFGVADEGGPQPLPAAWHFAQLREHYAATDQLARVRLMDSKLACGVFSSAKCPAYDIDEEELTLRIGETDE